MPEYQLFNFSSMARKKLFSTPKELYEGYFGEISTQKGRKKKDIVEARKVTLKGRLLNNGKISLYLYSCINGNVSRISTGSFLNLETDATIKAQNEETIRFARTKADLMNADAEREENGFRPIAKSRANLIEFTLMVADEALSKTHNKHGYYYNLQALARHLQKFRGEKIRISDVDKDFVLAFIDYLRNDASNINYLRAEDKEKWSDVPLSGNSQHRLFANLHYVIKKAVKSKILPRDPFLELDTEDKPKENLGTREYLTTEELKRLIQTPVKNEMIKRAFLFSCFCGLRWSDVSRLRWGDLKTDDVGFFADVTMVKTKRQVKAYISDVGSKWLPVRNEEETDKDLVFKLPKNEHVNTVLKKWAKDAEIKKTVSFHVSRHTAATMLLNLDVPLEVVAKQLGHGKISTTQIYAKILGKTQKAAIDKQNDLFK